MSSMGNVTAVIPAYNSADSISIAIDSVLAQTLPVYEILVIDDGSHDETFKVASQYGHPVRVLRKKNGGCSSARNLGILESRGEWIAFLDSDDTWLPERIARQADVLTKHPELEWLAGRYEIYRGEHQIRLSHLGTPPINNSPVQKQPIALLAQGCSIWTGTVLARKSILDRVGYFSEDQKTGEDFELWFRLALATDQVGYVHEPVARYQVGNVGSLTGQSSHKGDRSWIRLIERFIDARSSCSEEEFDSIEKLITLKSDQIVRNTIKSANPAHARWLIGELKKMGVRDISPKLQLLAFCPRPILTTARRLFRRNHLVSSPRKPSFNKQALL